MKKMIIAFLSGCLTIFICFNFAQVNAATPPHHLDRIVAVVNEEVITHAELEEALNRAKAQIKQAHLSLPDEAVLQKQVLEQLINKNLQLQLAKNAGIQISDEEVNKIIAHVAEQNHMKVAELYHRINKEGMPTPAYRQEIRDQVTIQKLEQQEVASKLSVTPEEVNAFIKSRAWLANTDKEYHLEDILIPLADNPTPEQISKAKEKALNILAKLQQGKNFRKMAQIESRNSQALAGGNLGWRKLPEIPSAFTEQVIRMKVKEISGPIQTPNGFHIIRLASIRNIDTKKATPQRKQIEELLFQQKLEESVQNWTAKLRTQAYISFPTTYV